MTEHRCRIRVGVVVVLAATVAASFVHAQDASRSPAGKNIIEIRVVGNDKVGEHEIRGQIKTRVGQAFSRDAIQDDVRSIYALGRFNTVEPETQVTDTGVILTFRVTERAKIDSVTFQGLRSLKLGEVQTEAGVSAGDFLDPAKLTLARQRVADLYKSKGYYFASVEVDREQLTRNNVVFLIREGPKVRVRKVQFKGNNSVTSAKLSGQIETKKYMWILSPGTLDETTVKADVTRLLQYYRDQGFMDAEVGYQFQFSDDKKSATVVFLVNEGPQYRVAAVKFEGNKVFNAAQIRAEMLLQPDAVYTEESRLHDVKAIRENVYGGDGYVDTKVDIKARYADEKGQVNVTVTVVEGERIMVGRIDIEGNDITHDKVVRRQLTFLPEQPYSIPAEKQSKQRLMSTGLFKDVTITPAAQGAGDERDVLVLVEESRTTNFIIGAGYSTDAGLLGNITIENKNFDLLGWPKSGGQLFSSKAFKGAGQTLRLVLEPGTEIMRFQIQFFEPYLMDSPYSLSTNLYAMSRPRESYTESHLGYVVAVGRRLTQSWSIEGAARIEAVDITDLDHDAPQEVRDDEGMHTLFAPRFSIARDTTDSRFLPTAGDRMTLSVEPVTGTDSFVRFFGDYRKYYTVRTDIYDRKSVVSGRLGAGYIAGDSPVFENFYAGGITTMRGFKYRTVSPKSGPDHDPIGGQFELLASTEYAFPLIGKSQGAFFLDTGTVEENATITGYRASVGFEVRIPVDLFGPIPLTFGIGVPVVKQDHDDDQIFYFLVGTSF